MLQAEKINEDYKNDKWIYALTIIFFIVMMFMAIFDIDDFLKYYDIRYPLIIKFMFWGNIICPIINLSLEFVWFLARHKLKFLHLLKILVITEIPLILVLASVPLLQSKYYFALGDVDKYIVFLICNLIFLIFLIFYIFSHILMEIRKKSIKFTYSGENLFFLGQIITKLRTTTKSLSLICITIVLSINIFLMVPPLIGWMFGYLDVKTLYDIQIYSRYNKTHSIGEVSEVNYSAVNEFLKKRNVKLEWDCSFDLYLPKSEQFTNRAINNFPVLAISLSDYNKLRMENNLEPISLGSNEFTTQWQAIALDKSIEEFVKTNEVLNTDGGDLHIFEKKFFHDDLGESLYNNYTEAIYVVPDEVCKKLVAVNHNYYINTEEALPYEVAADLEEMFGEFYLNHAEGIQYFIRINTLQKNNVYAASFILKASMTYTAVVLLVICFTILALHQLYDATNNKYRFSVLYKIGVDKKRLKGLIFKQLILWFGLPIGIGILFSIIFSIFLYAMISSQIAAYVAIDTLILQIIEILLVLVSLVICYFLTTWYLFKRTIFTNNQFFAKWK